MRLRVTQLLRSKQFLGGLGLELVVAAIDATLNTKEGSISYYALWILGILGLLIMGHSLVTSLKRKLRITRHVMQFGNGRYFISHTKSSAHSGNWWFGTLLVRNISSEAITGLTATCLNSVTGEEILSFWSGDDVTRSETSALGSVGCSLNCEQTRRLIVAKAINDPKNRAWLPLTSNWQSYDFTVDDHGRNYRKISDKGGEEVINISTVRILFRSDSVVEDLDLILSFGSELPEMEISI